MKSVLISIRPKWCELIASGKKTIEVRKTRPKLETPFKCYIYCTKPSFPHEDFLVFDAGKNKVKAFYGGGKIIGEFVCDKIVAVLAHPTIFAGHPMFFEKACKDACLSYDEIEAYAGDKDVYGWHITDLKIYDKPREISEFCTGSSQFVLGANGRLDYSGMTRPPQSWCYVEEGTSDG
jgi:hypothetical protein